MQKNGCKSNGARMSDRRRKISARGYAAVRGFLACAIIAGSGLGNLDGGEAVNAPLSNDSVDVPPPARPCKIVDWRRKSYPASLRWAAVPRPLRTRPVGLREFVAAAEATRQA